MPRSPLSVLPFDILVIIIDVGNLDVVSVFNLSLVNIRDCDWLCLHLNTSSIGVQRLQVCNHAESISMAEGRS
ncbi:hypothetical protein DL93DRAFT_2080631 [Clavulina sp. PMI_390]|nr:hypothetical protein DL93DRAFT_2080631 [Clavulina sp. PMI_390]